VTTTADLHRIGLAGDVPLLEGRSVTVAGRRVAIFRLADGYHAIDAACPHLGGPLADGLVADRCVTCPLHGRRFDLRTGAALGDHAGVAVHEVVERDGELWLRVTADALAAVA
jgi:nitrite reductase (NADH) small subunit